jgi:predicted hotdog family 3-hydroxylacyl-ACP dehydratase
MPLNHAQLAALIPHAGNMCLLDAVQSWDETHIACTALSHRDVTNPLRSRHRLHALCGVEYAAQAMAIHGALSRGEQKPTPGLLAAARDVTLSVQRLDDVAAPLAIMAEKLIGDEAGVVYRFRISAAGRELLAGRATVFFFPQQETPA